MENAATQTFRGSSQATIDDKGRLKLPARVKTQLEESFGADVFVMSLEPGEVCIYPMSVYVEMERHFLAQPSMDPLARRWLEHANYGHEDAVDAQGRVLLPALLRDVLSFTGEVVVSGRGNFLAVVKRDRAMSELTTRFTEEEYSRLAELQRAAAES